MIVYNVNNSVFCKASYVRKFRQIIYNNTYWLQLPVFVLDTRPLYILELPCKENYKTLPKYLHNNHAVLSLIKILSEEGKLQNYRYINPQ